MENLRDNLLSMERTQSMLMVAGVMSAVMLSMIIDLVYVNVTNKEQSISKKRMSKGDVAYLGSIWIVAGCVYCALN